jgi:flagellar hook-associated protein 1 FlgK
MANVQAGTSTSVNGIIGSPTTGIGSDIDAFFNAWSGLASNPTDANQLAVVQAGQQLSEDIQGSSSSLTNLQSSLTQQVGGVLTTIQNDSNQIAQLNTQILQAQATGGSPNSLMDERDQVVQNLASQANVTVQTNPNGSYNVSLGNMPLVTESGANTLPTQWNAAAGTLSNGQQTYQISSGQLAGLFDSLNKVNGYEGQLNTLANQLSTQVNSLYGTAKDSTGATGGVFFTGSGAAGLTVNSALVSDPSTLGTGTTGAAADVGVAQQLADLGTQALSGLDNQTVSGYYGQLVNQIGEDGQTATNAQSTQQALSQQVQSQIQSVSGVNLNDEMSNLLQYQQSYQAAAQALTNINQAITGLLSTFTETP